MKWRLDFHSILRVTFVSVIVHQCFRLLLFAAKPVISISVLLAFEVISTNRLQNHN